MFAKVEQYQQRHRDCLVPKHYKEDPSLGRWVNTQCRRRGKLDSDQITRLESIGFIWDPLDRQWEEMFAKLEQYRIEHGNCLVPNDYKEDPSIGRWVSKQRTRCEELVPTRRERLESIGFVWNPYVDQPWEYICVKLEQYCRQHGDCFVTKKLQRGSCPWKMGLKTAQWT
jgi:hypothetical protein